MRKCSEEVNLTLLSPAKFFRLFCHLIYFKINFFKKFFQEYHLSVGPDLGPNCLQMLSADNLRKEIKS